MIPPDTKILVVDDMPTIRDLVKSQLKNMGLKNVSEAADGQQALNMLVQNDAAENGFKMVISDWNMPKMSGIELLKQCRASDQWKNIPFVLLTSESEREQVTDAVLAGVSQYIVKPFPPKQFEEKVNQAWQKHNK